MGFVKVEQQGHVGILTIDRQEALNALNSQVLNDLDAAIDEVAANDDVYVVVLTGAGRSFVAGADIGEMKGFSSADGKKFGVHGGGVFLKLENMAKPVIAAINGFALGGGCELSMACDIRLASEKAKFGQPEVGLGITPGFAGTQRLPRIVGISKAMELILTAKVIGAAEAKAIGLVSEVYPKSNSSQSPQVSKTQGTGTGQCHLRQRPDRRAGVQALHPHGHADRYLHRLRFRGRGFRRLLRHGGQG